MERQTLRLARVICPVEKPLRCLGFSQGAAVALAAGRHGLGHPSSPACRPPGAAGLGQHLLTREPDGATVHTQRSTLDRGLGAALCTHIETQKTAARMHHRVAPTRAVILSLQSA